MNEAKQRLVAREFELKEWQQKLVLREDAHRKQCVELEQSITQHQTHTQHLQEQVMALDRARSKELEELNARLKQAYQMHEESEARASELLSAQEALGVKWRTENANNILHFQRMV